MNRLPFTKYASKALNEGGRLLDILDLKMSAVF